MNSCFKLQDVRGNYPDRTAMAFEHLTILMAFTFPMFPEIEEQREKSYTGAEIQPKNTHSLSFSLRSAHSLFSKLNYITYKHKFTTNSLIAWQVLPRNQNLKCSGGRVLLFSAVEMLCRNHLLFCSGRAFIFSMLLI